MKTRNGVSGISFTTVLYSTEMYIEINESVVQLNLVYFCNTWVSHNEQVQFNFPSWFAASKLNYNPYSHVYKIWGRYPVGMSAGWSETSKMIAQDASSLGTILNVSTRRVLGLKILIRCPSENVRPNRRWKCSWFSASVNNFRSRFVFYLLQIFSETNEFKNNVKTV